MQDSEMLFRINGLTLDAVGTEEGKRLLSEAASNLPNGGIKCSSPPIGSFEKDHQDEHVMRRTVSKAEAASMHSHRTKCISTGRMVILKFRIRGDILNASPQPCSKLQSKDLNRCS
jgi:hypothetical protein